MVKPLLALAVTFSMAGAVAAQTIAVHPERRTVTAGGSTFYTVSGRAFGETCAQLTAAGLPAGVTATFDDQPFCPEGASGETKLRIATSLSTPAGTYPFEVQARVPGSSAVYSGTAVLVIEGGCPVPTLVATASPSSGEAPLDVAFHVTGGGEEARYAWSFGDGATASGPSPTHVYAAAGAFAATVEVTTACGSKATAKVVVTVTTPCPVPRLSILADPDQGAAPLSVRFDSQVEGGDISSVEWDFGDGSRATGRSVTHVFRLAGTFAVRLQAVDSCGVPRSASRTILVGGRRRVVLGKKFEPTSARPRDVVRMTIRLTNETAEPLGPATVVDRLPAGLEYEGMDDGGAPQLDSGALRWTFEGASPGESLQWVVRLRVRRDASQRLENVAELESTEVTGAVRSNLAVLAVDLKGRLDKLAPPTVAPAGTIPYELRYPAGIDGAIEIVDELPAELELVSESSSLTFSREGRRLVWRGTTRGEEGGVRFEARVRSEIPGGTRITNEATLAFAGLDQPVTSNPVITEVTTVETGNADVSFRKSVDVPQSEIGRIVRYRLMLENNSASPLVSVRIEDLLPLGFSYVSATVLLDGNPGPEPVGTRRLVFTLPPVRPRGRMTLQYQTIIGPDTRRGKNLNDARLFAVDASGRPVNRQASAFVNVSSDGVVFTGAIEGRVFLDRDGDSSFGSADEPLEGIEIRLTRGLRARTGRSGAYRLEDLLPGEYAVGLQPRALPKGTVVASENPVAVLLPDGAEETVDFALLLAAEQEVPKGTLEVTAFLDRDGNGLRGPEEGALLAFGVTLDNTTRYRCEAGRCVLAHLPTGAHVVRVEAEGLSAERSVNLSRGTSQLDVPLPFKGIRIEIQAVQQ